MRKILNLTLLLGIYSIVFITIYSCENKAATPTVNEEKIHQPVHEVSNEPQLSEADQKKIIQRFESFIQKQRYNGSVLVAKNNQIVYDSIIGFSDVRSRIKLNDSSAFQLASISKPITAAVILSLIQDGKLKLEDKVTDILPNLPANYTPITIRMLLSHQTGLTQYYYYCENIMKRSEVACLSNDSLLDVIGIHNPGFCGKPGGRFDYCNTNYALLASVAEKIENKRFHQIINERVIKPSGMKNSFLLDLKNPKFPSNMVLGNNARDYLVPFDFLDGVVGDKGFFATAYDLFLFDRYFFDCLMVSESLMEEAFTPQFKLDKKSSSYGLGWRLRMDEKLGKIIFHTGWWRGNRHIYFKIPSKGYTVILLSNRLRGSHYFLNDLLEFFYDVE